MNTVKNVKRAFLIRLMAVLGFGGMTAFCLSSCQSANSNSDKQPKQETESEIVQEQPLPDADNTESSDTPSDTQNSDSYDQFFQESDFQIPVTKYGVPSPLPPDAYEHLDEMQVPPTPELNEERHNQNSQVNDNDLKPGLSDDTQDTKPDPSPSIKKIATRYGIRRPVKKYGIRGPVGKYGPPRDF